MSIFVIDSRFSAGWYAARLYSVTASTIVLLVLLGETVRTYAHLARSVMRRRGDRQARQLALDAMVASIVHEINQPLAAIVMNANAGLRCLKNDAPDLNEARASFKRIVDDGHRGSEIISSIRSMFKKGVHGRSLLSVNEVIQETLAMLDLELRGQRVSVETNLRQGLPQLLAERGQLHQVFLNLITNAIEAMASVTDRARVLRVTSDIAQGSPDILVTVADSGTGIEGDDKGRIFEPFFTTKPHGTGIGLSICRSIVESHGGRLRAFADKPYGMIFQVTLPSGDL